jgi:hypothetical protein
MHSLEHCTEVAALQAVTDAAGQPEIGPAVIDGTIGTLNTTWTVTAVAKLLAEADEVGWAPDLHEADGHGLVVLHGGGVYRFGTDRPRRASTADGPALRVITNQQHRPHHPGKAATA